MASHERRQQSSQKTTTTTTKPLSGPSANSGQDGEQPNARTRSRSSSNSNNSHGSDCKTRETSSQQQRRRRRRRRQHKNKQHVHKKPPPPPWITPKPKRSNPQSLTTIHNPVALYVQQRQEEAWKDFWCDSLDPLFASRQANDETQQLWRVLQGLFYMGVVRSVLLSACHVMLHRPVNDEDNDNEYLHALTCLAQYVAYGVTRVPTPGALSQRLAVLHVICHFREQQQGGQQETNAPQQQQQPNVPTRTVDPVLLWQFLLGEEEDLRSNCHIGGGLDNKDEWSARTPQEQPEQNNNHCVRDFQLWLSHQEVHLYIWIWELKGLVQHYLAEEEEERRLAHATADQLAHAVSMAAVTVELGLNQSTQALCRNMGQGCEWVKTQLGSPVKEEPHYHLDDPEEEEEDGPRLQDECNHLDEEDRTSQISSLSLSSDATSTATSAAGTVQSTNSQGSKKTKQGIVHDAYTSYSRSARQATETARQTTQSYVAHFKQVSGNALQQTAASSRAWATQNVHSNTQHWAYLDASAKVALASLGAMGVLGEAVLHNTRTLLDHTTTVTSDLVQHQFGPTAAHVFEDVSRTATNVWRTTAQVAGLASPLIVAKAVVKQASKERLRQQHEREQTLRRRQH